MGNFYRVVTRSALLYGIECWPVKKGFERKMDRIRNQEFRDKLGVAPISEKMRERRLRWFGHVK